MRAFPALGLLLFSACQALQAYDAYRVLQAHEREFAGVAVTAYAIHAELFPGEHRLEVDASITLSNGGQRALERFEWFLSPHARLHGIEEAGQALRRESRSLEIGDFAVQILDARAARPFAPGGETTLRFRYSLHVTAPSKEARLQPTEGYLRTESAWVPGLRTPLSETGIDRGALRLSIELPRELLPVGLGEFRQVAREGGRARYEAESSFPFYPFFAYGPYRKIETEAGGQRAVAYVGGTIRGWRRTRRPTWSPDWRPGASSSSTSGRSPSPFSR